jgi:hypothetical protein
LNSSITGTIYALTLVQRLIAEGKLDASKVSNPSVFITNLGKAHQKRIDESASKKGQQKMSKGKYTCPTCGKSFINLKQHIFKSHTKIHLTFKKDGKDYVLDAVTSDGTVLATNDVVERTGDDYKEYYMGEHEVGWYVKLYNNKKVEITSTTAHPKTGTESTATAFKNWDVKFIENENWKKLPQPKEKELEEWKPVVRYKSKEELKKEKEEKERRQKEKERQVSPAQQKAKEKRIDKKWEDEINKKKKEREELEQQAPTNKYAKEALDWMKKMDEYNLERTGNIYGVSRPLV